LVLNFFKNNLQGNLINLIFVLNPYKCNKIYTFRTLSSFATKITISNIFSKEKYYFFAEKFISTSKIICFSSFFIKYLLQIFNITKLKPKTDFLLKTYIFAKRAKKTSK